MIRQIIVGKCGCGKTLNYVGPSIEKYPGKVIWVNTKDDIEYLGLQNSVKSVGLNELKTLDSFDKIEIVVGIAPSSQDVETLMEFLNNYYNENLLMVFDEASITLGAAFPNILKNEKIGCDKLIVFQSIGQMQYLVDHFADNRIEVYDLQNELRCFWEVIELS